MRICIMLVWFMGTLGTQQEYTLNGASVRPNHDPGLSILILPKSIICVVVRFNTQRMHIHTIASQ